MSQSPDFQLLQNQGDPFEKIICDSFDDLGIVLAPYAEVWAKHIFPRREGDGAFVEAKWQSFSAGHYTSLIRLFHALCAKNELISLCKEIETTYGRALDKEDYKKLLKVQALNSSLWENLGSAADTLFTAWADARKLHDFSIKRDSGIEDAEPTNGKTIDGYKYPNLYFAYNRRTQYIHKIMVPKSIDEGIVVFDMKYYNDETTTWSREEKKLEDNSSYVEGKWRDIIDEFSTTWWRMNSWLKDNDKTSKTFDYDSIIMKPSSNELSATNPSLVSKVKTKPSGSWSPPSGSSQG